MMRRPAMIACLVTALFAPVSLTAQELEPRAYAANPVGVRFLVVSSGYLSGDIVLDPTAVITDAEATAYSAALAGGGTFALFGKVANASLALPYVWATVSGNVAEDRTSINRSGLGDTRIRLAINWLGNPAVSLADFARRTPSTVVGTSLAISIPTGQYFPDKLINIGTNRWAFKPEVGVSHPAGPWTLEVYAGSWLFARNASFYGNRTKAQQPLWSVQSHVAYSMRPRLWLAADATFYAGGRAVINGEPDDTRQENTRLGLTLSVPVLRTSSVKLGFSRGAVVRLGSNFNSLSLTWQTTRLPRLAPSRQGP